MAARRRRCCSRSSIWRGLLETIAGTIGIFYAPSALFVIAFGFVLIMLLHFSLVISRLADQNKVLAQRLGMLQQRVDGLVQARAEEDEESSPSHELASSARR